MLSDAAVEELRAYAWPGNVRELQNCIERAVILTEGDTIQPRHLSLSFRQPVIVCAGGGCRATALTAPADVARRPSPWDQIDLSGTMADVLRRVSTEVERRKIEQALRESARQPDGRRRRAAGRLQGARHAHAPARDSRSAEHSHGARAALPPPAAALRPPPAFACAISAPGQVLADRAAARARLGDAQDRAC